MRRCFLSATAILIEFLQSSQRSIGAKIFSTRPILDLTLPSRNPCFGVKPAITRKITAYWDRGSFFFQNGASFILRGRDGSERCAFLPPRTSLNVFLPQFSHLAGRARGSDTVTLFLIG